MLVQLKKLHLQNERLRNQIERYTSQFEHIQQEMNIQIDQMTQLKNETEKYVDDNHQTML